MDCVDRRIMKTREILKVTLMDKLEYILLNQISITDVTTSANINRSTFYAHYTDKYDLLDAAIEQYTALNFNYHTNIEKIDEEILKSIFMNVAKILREMKEKYALNFNAISHVVEKKIKAALQQVFQQIEQALAKSKDEKIIHISSIMLSWGIYGAALDWTDHYVEDAEIYIGAVIPMLLNGLKSI